MTNVTVTHEQIAQALAGPGNKFYPPTAEQEAIIEAPLTPLLVTAGAGSGKTQTMMNRVLWQVANGRVAPSEIIGLTFTRKATGELRERLYAGLDRLRKAGLADIDEFDLPEVSTYNSFADTLYRQNALLIGYEPDAQLLDAPAAISLMREVVLDSRIPELEMLESPSVATLVKDSLKLANEMRDNQVSAADIRAYGEQLRQQLATATGGDKLDQNSEDNLIWQLDELNIHAQLAESYQRVKRERGLIEFADQVVLARQVIANEPAVAQELCDRFKLIIFDEYQDTSVSQVKMLSEIFRGRGVVAVGDPKQSIYGWRGASSENMSKFYRDFGNSAQTPLSLSTSFRNDRQVLEAANIIAGKLPESADLYAKPLEAKPGAGQGSVELQFFARDEDEAESVANWMRSQLNCDPNRTAAVLVRSHRQITPIAEALAAKGIPFNRVGRGGLLETPEITHITCLIRAAANPYAGNELIRILTGAQYAIGLADVVGLSRLATQLHRQDPRGYSVLDDDARSREELDPGAIDSNASLAEALEYLRTHPNANVQVSETGRERMVAAAELLHQIRQRLQLPLPQVVDFCITASGVRLEAIANPSLAMADANLDAFVDAVSQFTMSAPGADFNEFLDWLDVAEQQNELEEVLEVTPEHGVVQLMTIHAAKGLEWDAVAIPGFLQGTLPNYNGARRWLSKSALPYPLRADHESLPSLDLTECATKKDVQQQVHGGKALDILDDVELSDTFIVQNLQHKLHEARRLTYVAMTRAREDLLITAAATRRQTTTVSLPSEFWFELQPTVPVLAGTDMTAVQQDGQLCDEHGEPMHVMAEHLWQAAKRDHSGDALVDQVYRVVKGNETVRQTTDTWPRLPMGEQKRAQVLSLATEVREAMDASATPTTSGGATGALAGLVDLLLAERDDTSGPVLALPERFGASKLSDIVSDPVGVAKQLARPIPQRPFAATLLGNLFHNWVESLYGDAVVGGALFAEGETLDEDRVEASLQLANEAEREKLASLQATFLASRFAVQGNTPKAVELPINMQLGDFALVGKIDAVYEFEDGTIEIVDWKTGRAPTTPKEIEQRELQLMCYAHAYAAGYEVPIERIRATLYYVADDREISIDRIESLERLERRLHEAEQQLRDAAASSARSEQAQN